MQKMPSFQGEIIEFSFEDTLFKTVQHTYVLTCSSSRNRQRIVDILLAAKPTRHVVLFVSAPWCEKKDDRIRNSTHDIGVNHACMYEHARHIDDYVLVLEDDATFWSSFKAERREIERFLRVEKPSVYLLGNFATWSGRHRFHFRVAGASGTHAQFLSRDARESWMRGLRSHLENSAPNGLDYSENPHSQNNGRVRRVYAYCRPLVTQVFCMSENRRLWNDSLSTMQKWGLALLMLDRLHSGWCVVYLYMAITYLLNLDTIWM